MDWLKHAFALRYPGILEWGRDDSEFCILAWVGFIVANRIIPPEKLAAVVIEDDLLAGT